MKDIIVWPSWPCEAKYFVALTFGSLREKKTAVAMFDFLVAMECHQVCDRNHTCTMTDLTPHFAEIRWRQDRIIMQRARRDDDIAKSINRTIIPPGVIGVILGLLLTGSFFGFMAFLDRFSEVRLLQCFCQYRRGMQMQSFRNGGEK